ncbi:MAG: DUF4430 domain-containing protein [Candidatus Berkelbacteria bacterium]|nr:DUF4430 domain-containing protein [Candidatus Berkelbacteria bacterium]
MTKHNKKLYIGIFIAILFGVIIIFSSTWRLNRQVTQTTPSQQRVEPPLLNQGGVKEGNSATILTGNTTILLSFFQNTTFYNALIQAKNEGKITFSGKNYPGLGFFVTDIGTLHSGSGKNLLYYINGKEATVGVSLYTLKDGDIIEWKLE